MKTTTAATIRATSKPTFSFIIAPWRGSVQRTGYSVRRTSHAARRTSDSGQGSGVSRQWSVVSRQWSAVNGLRSTVR
ncbi:MAG TPA: hypothetical protein ENJ02_09520 [Chloroflexi bacterium]|nr:hypothetical protein [Chloroflexota bacterium]